MARTWRSQIADEVRACSMMKPKPTVMLRKNGYYYRPNWRGYTSSPLEAGQYDPDEAAKHAANTDGVSIVTKEEQG